MKKRVLVIEDDAAISPLIIEESARPYFDYLAFSPAGLVNPATVQGQGNDNLVPSPLLIQPPASNVLFYFNGFSGDGNGGEILSPQVPPDFMRGWVESNYALNDLIAANDLNLARFREKVSVQDLYVALGSEPAALPLAREREGQPANDLVAQVNTSPRNSGEQIQHLQVRQAARNIEEFSTRKDQAEKAQSKILASKQQRYNLKAAGRQQTDRPRPAETQADANVAGPFPSGLPEHVRETIMRPVWVKGFLVLARRVKVDGRSYVQGAWLDWERIRHELLGEIKDLLPSAALAPAPRGSGADESRLLASLPVRLVPGAPASLPPVLASPLRIPLIVAWCCLLLAAEAVAVLLVGVVNLSERRATFVSAVTHELRTPLTTFRMYSEMLAENMVADQEKRRGYLATLCAEGSRLSHLVENVLAYARLERGGQTGNPEIISSGELLKRVRDRLAERSRQAGMELEVVKDENVCSAAVRADVGAVEQILFNLVDNACKYAAKAVDRRIHIECESGEGSVAIRVRDHGPGILPKERRRLFRPFHKSAEHAAASAPGVGLGLALSRRLARQMGGDLFPDGTVRDGACFVLTLPAVVQLGMEP